MLPGTLPQIFVSGPSAIRGWNEFLILATSAAHRCPKPLLYHSGECPLKKWKENYWETQVVKKHASQKCACHTSCSALPTVVVEIQILVFFKCTLKFSLAVKSNKQILFLRSHPNKWQTLSGEKTAGKLQSSKATLSVPSVPNISPPRAWGVCPAEWALLCADGILTLGQSCRCGSAWLFLSHRALSSTGSPWRWLAQLPWEEPLHAPQRWQPACTSPWANPSSTSCRNGCKMESHERWNFWAHE